MTAFEIVWGCKNTNKDICIIKVDFEKAFDTINWSFILQMFEAFASRWIQWVKHLLFLAHSSLLVNDAKGRTFKNKHGLRQGNPLSPLLFNLVYDVLSRLISRAAENDLVAGALYQFFPRGITHILFSDDLLLFSKDDENCIHSFDVLLRCFDLCSGLKLNVLKTKDASSINGHGQEQEATET
ncbi:hypothetical protein Cni_G28291 [Canna indica]|uniref:Reverse transcriptase domain-containing protein n=1 Tax=Canna indica TaxID=4628 RepID=A0AAQ3L6E2_9LILI|nr:hypothetical protein Cni_G28291 [Canna indica]